MADIGEVSIEQYTRDIWDQGSEPICICVAGADMLTTIYRMLGHKDLELSPKILIDARCFSIDDLKAIITNPELGLQSIHDYAFMFTRTLHQKIEYQHGERYWIDALLNYYNQSVIKEVIQENYSEHGKKFPLLASVAMGKFADNDVALAAFETPFRHDMGNAEYVESLNEEEPHTLLIVGANFSSKNASEHYLLVKNCYTDEWGQKGFSKMALEMVRILTQPILNKENIACVGWEEERTWTAGKITVNKRRRVSGQQEGQTEKTNMENMESSKKLQKRTIILSNLRMHTLKRDIYDYFNGELNAKVINISFNSFENKHYNKTCLVTFSSRKTAKRVMENRIHHIQGVKVTVKRYRGKDKHQKLFQRGEQYLFIKGVNEVSILHTLCEDIAVRCGPHSGIDFQRKADDGQLDDGKVAISFYEESHRQMALDIVRREYNWDAATEHWDATLSESVDQVDQD